MVMRSMLLPTSYVIKVRFIFLFLVLTKVRLHEELLYFTLKRARPEGFPRKQNDASAKERPHWKEHPVLHHALIIVTHNRSNTKHTRLIKGLLMNQAAYTQLVLIKSKHDIFLGSIIRLQPPRFHEDFISSAVLFLSPSPVNLTVILCFDCF